MMGTFPLCNGVRHQRPHAKEIVLCVCLYDFISSIFRHKLNYVAANRYQTNVFYLFFQIINLLLPFTTTTKQKLFVNTSSSQFF